MAKTTKKNLNIKAFNLFKSIVINKANGLCEVCRDPAITAHHYFPQGSYGYLKYEIGNGVSICGSCHFKHHTKGNPLIHEAIYKNRKKDIDKLKKIPRPTGTYITEKWIRDNIEKLLVLSERS